MDTRVGGRQVPHCCLRFNQVIAQPVVDGVDILDSTFPWRAEADRRPCFRSSSFIFTFTFTSLLSSLPANLPVHAPRPTPHATMSIDTLARITLDAMLMDLSTTITINAHQEILRSRSVCARCNTRSVPLSPPPLLPLNSQPPLIQMPRQVPTPIINPLHPHHHRPEITLRDAVIAARRRRRRGRLQRAGEPRPWCRSRSGRRRDER